MTQRSIVGIVGLVALALSGCGGVDSDSGEARTVVVYSALDREFAEPVLSSYQKKTGVEVLPKFDVESTKTVGLTNLIVAEARGRAATCSGTTRSSTRSG